MADQGFTDAEYQAALREAGTPDAAYALLWRNRAAQYSGLVDIQEGSSSRSMSQMYKNAMDQVAYYDAKVAGASGSIPGRRPARTRVIERG